MCCNFSILKQTENGLLLFLKGCKNYQLTYKNLNFSLSKEELDTLENYLLEIDIDYWEEEYKNSIYTKKIPIPTLQNNFMILLDRNEIEELLVLLDYTSKINLINPKSIIQSLNWN